MKNILLGLCLLLVFIGALKDKYLYNENIRQDNDIKKLQTQVDSLKNIK